MKTEKVYLKDFERDDSFYEPLSLLLTVKSFDLQAIRKRYLDSKNNANNKTGSVERRAAGLGGICYVQLSGGKLSGEKVLKEMKEPRGIAQSEKYFGIAAEDTVYIFYNGTVQKISDEWFSYIHTIDFSGDKVLVASSGLDCLFEFDIKTGKKITEWFAWENGFDRTTDPATGDNLCITRDEEKANAMRAEGRKVLLVKKPKEQSLPTAMRAAFINSVVYDVHKPGHLLATFFHEGTVYQINQTTGKAQKVLGNMKNPHGGNTCFENYMATSTGTGEIVIGNTHEEVRYSFAGLPGKPDFLNHAEWLQNTIRYKGNFITIDSNRTSFVIWDIARRKYSMVPYNNNWAVQDMCAVSGEDEQLEKISRL